MLVGDSKAVGRGSKGVDQESRVVFVIVNSIDALIGTQTNQGSQYVAW